MYFNKYISNKIGDEGIMELSKNFKYLSNLLFLNLNCMNYNKYVITWILMEY